MRIPSNRSISSTGAVLNTYVKDVMSDLYKSDKKLRREAAKHVKGAIRKKINASKPSLPGEPPGKVTGNLLKGLAMANKKTVSLVGFKAPARHALLLEFGGKNVRTTKSGASRGFLDARPVLFPTMAEEAGRVRSILEGNRL